MEELFSETLEQPSEELYCKGKHLGFGIGCFQ